MDTTTDAATAGAAERFLSCPAAEWASGAIYCGDSLQILPMLPANSVDLVFVDPPYNITYKPGVLQRADGRGAYDSVDDEWDKFASTEEYLEFCRCWLEESRRVLKKDGTIWVMGSFHNIYSLGNLMLSMGWWILNDVIWEKNNPAPHNAGRRLQHAHETLLWCKPNKDSRYHINYHEIKRYNDGKQLRDVWKLPICQGNQRLKGPDGKKLHSTQKPEALMEMVIATSTERGDIILDPFFGTGTTGVVAQAMKRRFIGIEQDETYVMAAAKRIAADREALGIEE